MTEKPKRYLDRARETIFDHVSMELEGMVAKIDFTIDQVDVILSVFDSDSDSWKVLGRTNLPEPTFYEVSYSKGLSAISLVTYTFKDQLLIQDPAIS